MIYSIYADEAWTHSEDDPNARYWNFFGAFAGESADINALNKDLNRIYQFKNEIKWTNLDKYNIPIVKKMVDTVFLYLEEKKIFYRQLFMDKKYMYNGDIPKEELLKNIYFIFSKHAFGLYDDVLERYGYDRLEFYIDDYVDRGRTEKFKKKLESHFHQIKCDVIFVDSKTNNILQMSDIFIGAAGYYGNYQAILDKDTKNLSQKTICKLHFSKYIYDKLSEITYKHSGKRAFQWFESTKNVAGHANRLNAFNMGINIWKFKPTEHSENNSWENDSHLLRKELKTKQAYRIKNSKCETFD